MARRIPNGIVHIELKPTEEAPVSAIITSHGEDVVGIVASLAQLVDECKCAFEIIGFRLDGLEQQNHYKLEARVRPIGHGEPGHHWLKLLSKSLQRAGNNLHELIGEEWNAFTREWTNTGHSHVYAMSCECPDREGILECLAIGIRKLGGNIAYLRGDLNSGSSPTFVIIAVVAYQSVKDPKEVQQAIRDAFETRDQRDRDRSQLKPEDPSYVSPANVLLSEEATVRVAKIR